ncbi:hypothetical protein EKO27_g234 [Xylaria grammica]|uniref:Major facilitator superfamily (MFS) profile domain-containing protein n=1 Tax=Xylaria grammica TaxID=363999 RepID=A0A439DKK6_9PEZI|nr:hypothetical protein EKO27_g234 [Xylaria grammica]
MISSTHHPLQGTPLGDLLRYLSRRRLMRYPEDQDGFVPVFHTGSGAGAPEYPDLSSDGSLDQECGMQPPNDMKDGGGGAPTTRAVLSGTEELGLATEKGDGSLLGHGQPMLVLLRKEEERQASPDSRRDRIVMVDWYSPSDTANPKNFSTTKKLYVYFAINYANATVYLSSSIYAASQPGIMAEYGVSSTVASLGLALYVLGYGVGPIVLSPLADVDRIGRNPPYLVSMSVFVLLSILAATSSSLEGILVLRFLQGFFGSPLLSSGGASLSDICNEDMKPFALYTWACSGFGAASLAPIISGYTVVALGWRWPLWEVVIFNAPALLFLLLMPETSEPTILDARARRLQARDPSTVYRGIWCLQHVDSPRDLLFRSIIIPWKMHALDPSILFTSLFTGLVYGIYYSFFEVFPIVYEGVYGLHPGPAGLPYFALITGVIAAGIPYCAFVHYYVNRRRGSKDGEMPPERRLLPAVLGSFLVPTGLFLFAFTARSDVHWIIPTLGFGITASGLVLILQCIFVYITYSYPRYSASAFGGNACVRSFIAFAALLWSRPLYDNLGVARGSSILGGACVLGIIGIFVLYFYGAQLRARSRFAA